ncbi:hypothetical protein DCAR_0624839 [Daucus carota subsp. sativus]|uniref:RPW8 domain-containing protein n=1 Tax=Daucus carota subsp. sativus TaxID=79200 RepID=A0AAF1B5I8_DAUCS|nr:hypothetical protein DCAR_0624839 [Daucus carota subsp. sativus]
MELLAGAALGAVMSELFQVVKTGAKHTLSFKSNLKTLKKTLKSVKPIFDTIEKLQEELKELEHQEEEILQFTKKLQSGVDLVKYCSTIHYLNVFKRPFYSKKLGDLDKAIVKFFNIQVQGLTAVNSLRAVIGVKQNGDKLDSIHKSLSIGEYSGFGAIPGVPIGVVGFDQPLKELKEMLLDDKVKIKVVSAPGGCGKTTLAKMLCNDPDIQKKPHRPHREHPYFVTISRLADTTDIVKKIIQQLPSSQLPDFHSDEDAINHLECLLKRVSPSHILLVLDDVWREGVSLVDSLFSLRGILVTSRFSFQRFKPVYNLKILNDQDAMTLFCQYALPDDGSSTIPYDLVEKTVRSCKGFPIALKVVGRSLYGQEEVKWRHEQMSWSDSTSKELLDRLQPSLDALDEMNESSLKDCCLDLGSFPEDQKVSATTLMDIWAELYNLNDEKTYCNLVELAFRNLVNLFCTRQTGNEADRLCNERSVMQHDLLRDLTIHQSNTEPIKHRKRLFIEMQGNNFPQWWTEEMNQPIQARLLSISTDKNFSGSWFPLTLPAVEVVILNCSSAMCTIPEFIEKMNQLKVLIVTNYGASFSKLSNFQILGSLPNLRRMRFERVSLSFLDTPLLKPGNLQKISFTMCEIGTVFENTNIDLSHVFPNLEEIEIDCCEDLLNLHVGLCDIVSLKKISITNCNGLSALPEEIGRLTNLEYLLLNSCTNLLELPESVADLHRLKVLDISDCLNISNLPGRVGELRALKTIHMGGCLGLSELHKLPSSVKDLTLLKKVICDVEASHLWESYGSHLKNLKVEVVKEDAVKSLMRVISSIQHS